MKTILFVMLLLTSVSVKAEESLLEKPAAQAAVADAATTAIFMSKGIKEGNPLIGQSQANNLIALGVKLALVDYVQTLREEDRKPLNKFITGVYGGSAINNLMYIVGAASGVAIVAGLVGGVYLYHNTDGK